MGPLKLVPEGKIGTIRRETPLIQVKVTTKDKRKPPRRLLQKGTRSKMTG